MAAREIGEAFPGQSTIQVDGQNAFDLLGNFGNWDETSCWNGHAAFATIAATQEKVEARALIGFGIHLGGQESNISDEMLGAGMTASGKMDIDGLIEADASP